MASESKNSELEDESLGLSLNEESKISELAIDNELSAKCDRNDEKAMECDTVIMVVVKFENDSEDIYEYRKAELMTIEFCKAKLERWCANVENDDSKDEQQYFIDLSVFPSMTPKIFNAIVHCQVILSESSNQKDSQIIYQKAAKTLLTDNIKINDLPQLFEVCKILLVTKIFDKKLFDYYFDEYHPPIKIGTFQQFQNTHQNHPFFAAILVRQTTVYDITNNYSIHKAIYDRFNELGTRDYPCIDFTPNGEYAMQYATEQILFEDKRGTGSELHGGYRADIQYMPSNTKMRKDLRKDIDYGLCAAFDDMVESGVKFEPFLTQFFTFITESFLSDTRMDDAEMIYLDEEWTIRAMDYSHFCFYALAYIAHRIWILYLQNNAVVINYNFAGLSHVCAISGLFDQILSHQVTQKYFWSKSVNAAKMRVLMQQRINDGLKYKEEWNSSPLIPFTPFPEAVIVPMNVYFDSYPEWLINNFALKCNNGDCRKVMRHILKRCIQKMDDINISEALKNTFEQYLGVKIQESMNNN